MTNLLMPTPAGACDCHMHVFGNPEEFPLSPNRSYTPAVATFDDYRALAGAVGLERAVLVQASAYGADNACQLAACDTDPGGTRCVGGFDVSMADRDIEALHGRGVRGIRINCVSKSQSDVVAIAAEIRAVHDRIAAFGWHIQLYARAETIAELEPFLAGLETYFVFDHMALPRTTDFGAEPIRAVLRLLERNGWIKLAGSDRVLAETGDTEAAVVGLMRDFIDAAPERTLWGTDWPNTGAHPGKPRKSPVKIENRHLDPGLLLNRLARACGSEERYARVLSENPARLYRFGA